MRHSGQMVSVVVLLLVCVCCQREAVEQPTGPADTPLVTVTIPLPGSPDVSPTSLSVQPTPIPTDPRSPTPEKCLRWRCGNVAGISLVDAETGWAVVNCAFLGGIRTLNTGLVYRLIDGEWRRMDDAPILGPPYSCYKAISAVGPEEMWAVGLAGGNYACEGGVWLLHYLDGNWEVVGLEEDIFAGHWEGLLDITMVDAENGWAVGYDLILRYDHDHWSVDLSLASDENVHVFETISMADINDGWAGGYGGLLFRYHQGSWTRWEWKNEDVESTHVMDIHTLSSSDAWAVGYRETNTAPYYSPLAWHYTGDYWQEVTLPIEEEQLRGVVMIEPNEGWMVSDSGRYGSFFLLHYLDGQWETQRLSMPDSHPYSIGSSVDAVEPGQVWVGAWGFYHWSSPDTWKHIELAPTIVSPYD